jgi:RNA polymerase sigma-70 factor (ECF subfamily)
MATGNSVADGGWMPAGLLSWLTGSRVYRGRAVPDHPGAQIEPYIPGLRRFARALLRGNRERADDLVQDCVERALSCWHLRRAEGDLRGWLYTILYNRFLTDRHRERRRGMHASLTEVEADREGVDGGQEAALVHRDLVRAFAELPEEQRSVLFLVSVEDLSYAETARVLGVPIGTVMSRLSRGRERLRQLMGEDRRSHSLRLGRVK